MTVAFTVTSSVETTDNDFARELNVQTTGCAIGWQWIGKTRQLTDVQKEVASRALGTNTDSLSASKRLFNTKCPEFRAMTRIKNRVNKYFTQHTLPFPQRGVRLIKRDSIEGFESFMHGEQHCLEVARELLNDEWAELVKEAKGTLGDLFDPSDYPDNLNDTFKLAWTYPTLTPPEYLRRLSGDAFRRESARVRAQFEQAVSLAEEAFTAELGDMVRHLTEVLTGQVAGEDGERRPRIFRDSAVENLHEFFERFRTLNIGSSQGLNDLVNEVQQVIGETTPQELRNSRVTREELADRMQTIARRIEEQSIVAPRRQISIPGIDD